MGQKGPVHGMSAESGELGEPAKVVTSGGVRWADMDEEARTEFWASLALRHCKGLGARSCSKLLSTFGNAFTALEARKRWAEAGLTSAQAAEMATGSWRITAREEWNNAQQVDARILLWRDALYPELLRRLPDAPVLLYARGDMSLLRSPACAVVGSRKASPQGRAVAAYMARCLSACGIAVVAGMAMGVDKAAHDAALTRIGRSIGVLGTGIDVIYPRANTHSFAAMEEHGLLLSEFAPNAPPLAEHFPIRNRIISGLALGVLVVEAAGRSGSLITARLALEQNREVYAVPGPALDAHCLGCQDLVRQGAKPVFSADDVLLDLAEQLRPYGISRESLPADERDSTLAVQSGTAAAAEAAEVHEAGHAANVVKAAKSAKIAVATGSANVAIAAQRIGQSAQLGQSAQSGPLAGAPTPDWASASENVRERVLTALRSTGPLAVDDLAAALSMDVPQLSGLLVEMEMLGQIKRLAGARYEVAL